jgi:hypothetical protein
MQIIIVLILFFILLLGLQIFLANFNNYEGFENNNNTEFQPYNLNDPNNVLILAKQNAGNIDFLKQQVDTLNKMKVTIDDLTNRVVNLEQNVVDLMQQQKDYANELTGGEELEVTGV